MPIVTACEISRNSLSNKEMMMKLDRISGLLKSGVGFSSALGQIDVFSVKDVQMVKIGEESGKLDYVMSNLSENYFETMEALVGSAIVFVEVFFILIVAPIASAAPFAKNSPSPAPSFLPYLLNGAKRS